MAERPYDLWFDPNAVGGDMVAECWISHGPRSKDRRFDPHPGDQVTVGDGEELPLIGDVLRRDGDRVTVRLHVLSENPALA